MGLSEKFLPNGDRVAALMLYGMVFSTCFNGYGAGIMTVILADDQFTSYYNVTPDRQGVIAVVSWMATGLAQIFFGGTLASLVGRLWALRLSILFMCLGVVVQVFPNAYAVLLVGRLMTGLVYIATNLYVAECAPRLLRGSFVDTVSQFGYQLGTLIAFWAGYGMSFHKINKNAFVERRDEAPALFKEGTYDKALPVGQEALQHPDCQGYDRFLVLVVLGWSDQGWLEANECYEEANKLWKSAQSWIGFGSDWVDEDVPKKVV